MTTPKKSKNIGDRGPQTPVITKLTDRAEITDAQHREAFAALVAIAARADKT